MTHRYFDGCPFVKHEPYRNRKILDAANGQHCQMCGIKDGTVVAAHSNASEHGKGKGEKAEDCYIMFACNKCHHWYDFAPEPAAEKQKAFERAMYKTWRLLLELGILK